MIEVITAERGHHEGNCQSRQDRWHRSADTTRHGTQTPTIKVVQIIVVDFVFVLVIVHSGVPICSGGFRLGWHRDLGVSQTPLLQDRVCKKTLVKKEDATGDKRQKSVVESGTTGTDATGKRRLRYYDYFLHKSAYSHR